MKSTISTIFILFLSFACAFGQNLYSKTWGKPSQPAMIFLHGGPGYNASVFEASTAQRLANEGFFVIAYDRRGEGRSADKNASYNFDETIRDLNALYQKYGIQRASLIGHSFGGIVATVFAEKNPEKVHSLFLVGAPIALQESFQTIITSSQKIYEARKDTTSLKYLGKMATMDKNSIAFASYCFAHAMQNGFYTPKKPTEEAKKIYDSLRTDTLVRKYGAQMSSQAPMGFWKNEKYTSLDLTSNIQGLLAKKVKIYGLYGKEDGLYSPEQVQKLQKMLGQEKLKYYENCSHSVFVDQQTEFIKQLKLWAR